MENPAEIAANLQSNATQGHSTGGSMNFIVPTIDHNHPLYLQPKETPRCNCPESKKFQEHCEYQRVLEFLMGLNETYSTTRGQILMQSPTPNLNKMFSLIINHKSQRNLAGHEVSLSKIVESTTMFSQKGGNSGNSGRGQSDNVPFGYQPGGNGGNPGRGHYDSQYNPIKTQKPLTVCEVCGFRGHTKDQYFKVKEYPVGWKSKRKTGNEQEKGCAYINHVETPNPTGSTHTVENLPANLPFASPAAFFTSYQYNQIMQLLAKGSDTGGDSSTKAATTGRILSALVTKHIDNEWIIDMGASNHMKSKVDILNHFTIVPMSERRQVNLPNGNVVSVSHIGSTTVLGDNVIGNLLFVKGIGREDQGLYILKDDFTDSAAYTTCSQPPITSNTDSNTLWHKIPGYAPVEILKKFGSLDGLENISDKFSPRAIPVALLGYSNSQKGYLLYDLHSKSLFVNRHVVFKKDVFSFKDVKPSSDPVFPVLTMVFPDNLDSSSQEHPVVPHPVVAIHSPTMSSSPTKESLPPPAQPPPSRKSSRPVKPLLWIQDFVTKPKTNSCVFHISNHVSYTKLYPTYQSCLNAFSAFTEPSSFMEASLDP
ncbi:uncharacterized protein LOC125814480 [Solanum verrucosum]|uniref:uncharacterized protein LOC125814480 n=1 Tax=Solanum verrucosum TaxID=315347 RepID=UPI0020D15A0B|nr:uncharacterized protein LOC125814480 [Solanum verrucosum]